MIHLIVTADEALFQRLAGRARSDGDQPRWAVDVLSALEQALSAEERPGLILLDIALRSADTLLEALHDRPETAGIPLVAVAAGEQLPYALRRLCAAVIDRDSLDHASDRS